MTLKFAFVSSFLFFRPFRPQISSRGDTTFTAANLINAIITHQISQNNTDPPIGKDIARHSQVIINYN